LRHDERILPEGYRFLHHVADVPGRGGGIATARHEGGNDYDKEQGVIRMGVSFDRGVIVSR